MITFSAFSVFSVFSVKNLSQLIVHKDTLEKKQSDGLTLSEQEELAQDNEALKVQHASEGGTIWLGGYRRYRIGYRHRPDGLIDVVCLGGFSGLQVAKKNALNSMIKQSNLGPHKNDLQDIWLEHNVSKQGINGMTIHFSFIINDLKEIKCGAIAQFYYENKQPLKDFNNAYRTPEGYVAVYKDFIPPSERAIYQDFVLFMPYQELHITPPFSIIINLN